MKRFHRLSELTLLVIGYLIANTNGDAPNFQSGFGLTVHNVSNINPRLYDVYVKSDQVYDSQEIVIFLPNDYTTSGPNRRYPVLYLLHGGGGCAQDWTLRGGKVQEILGNLSLIVVMPFGDQYGWYTNWITPGKKHSPQNWRTYHNEELIPWIDFNLRTVAKKGGRAIGGLSMGGFGAIRYAEVYPQLYTYTTSFSGALDLEDIGVQIAVFFTDEYLELDGFGPFGLPFILNNASGFVQQNPLTHAESLRGMDVAIYTGNVGIIEEIVHTCAIRMDKMLTSLNIPHYFLDYGNGSSIGQNCSGEHQWECWNADLRDVAPRMMAVLEQQHAE